MDVEVDETGAHHTAGRIDDVIAVVRGHVSADIGDPPVDDAHVTPTLARLVEQTAIAQQHGGHEPVRSTGSCIDASCIDDGSAPSRSNSTAIRTAMPLVTCCVITAPGSSAGSTVISTPRFIGPGCMTNAWGARRAARCAVRPKRIVYSRRLGTSASFMRSCCMRSRYRTS